MVPHCQRELSTEHFASIGVEIDLFEIFWKSLKNLSELEETFIDCWRRVPGIENREEGVNFAEHMRDGKRIPLRGQEGMSLDQIESFERAGYRMSGYNKRQTEARKMRAERKV